MTKPTLQAVDPETKTNTPALDPFDPANLRLNQSFTETVGVKKLRLTVPVRASRARRTSCGSTPTLSTATTFRSSSSRMNGRNTL